MTEPEWLVCADPRSMSDTALNSPRASDRTCRLYVAAFWAWQAHHWPHMSDDERANLLRRAAVMEHWAEKGKLPKGSRASRSEDGVFFNRNAKRAVQNTIGAPSGWGHSGAEAFAVQPPLLREIFGNPFQPVAFDPEWRTETAVALAKQMYEAREFGAMPILADALQDAGCDNEDVLAHGRGSGPHVHGCWVVDLVLGNG
jgi:hypothetical protein